MLKRRLAEEPSRRPPRKRRRPSHREPEVRDAKSGLLSLSDKLILQVAVYLPSQDRNNLKEVYGYGKRLNIATSRFAAGLQRGTSLLDLSDELLLQICSHLSLHDLNNLEAVCRSVSGITLDSTLWRALYYRQYIYPRAAHHTFINPAPQQLEVPEIVRQWLDEDVLVKRGTHTRWKHRYKVRYKWTNGSCEARDIEVYHQPTTPPRLVHLYDGIIYTLDTIAGLRAYSSKRGQRLLGKVVVTAPPTLDVATCICANAKSSGLDHQILIGFASGKIKVFEFSLKTTDFKQQYEFKISPPSMPTALAFHSPFLLSMCRSDTLLLYRLPDQMNGASTKEQPRLLQSVSSHVVSPPHSLGVRRLSNGQVIATIAFFMRGSSSDWTVGIQEQILSPEGELITSRFASSPYAGLSLRSALSLPSSRSASPFSSIETRKPTSISYTHPHILLSHTDNTLTSYHVTSDENRLEIGPGHSMFGHSSGVSAVHVSASGIGVSITKRGDELRIWQLYHTPFNLSVRVRPEPDLRAKKGSVTSHDDSELGFIRNWIGVDDENAVVLHESHVGKQALVVYDFS